MPTYRLTCKSCGCAFRKLAKSIADATEQVCKSGKCCEHQNLYRSGDGPSSQVVEKLDNGIMPRAVERLSNAPELLRERARNSDPLAGGGQRSERLTELEPDGTFEE